MNHPETITCSEAARRVGLKQNSKNISIISRLAKMGAIDTYTHNPRRIIVVETLEACYDQACRNGKLAEAREFVNTVTTPEVLRKTDPTIIPWRKNEKIRIVDGKVIQRPKNI